MHNELPSSATFDVELPRVNQIIPEELRPSAAQLVAFLEEYYRYTNSIGQASNALNVFLREQDIDHTTDPYFVAIQAEIARPIPNSNVFDRQTLYKRIIDYYSTRGSEASITGFFKIFYNRAPTIYYPKTDLLRPSSGDFRGDANILENYVAARDYFQSVDPSGDYEPGSIDYSAPTQVLGNWIMSQIVFGNYVDSNGFLSDIKKLQDSNYWQDFSYVIHTDLSVLDWQSEFLKLVHPAGMKFFGNLQFIVVTYNTWTETIPYGPTNPESWFKAPPTPGSHSPASQPGWITDRAAINYIYCPDPIQSPIEDDQYHSQYPWAYSASVAARIDLTSVQLNPMALELLSRNERFYNDYENYLKFYDPAALSSYYQFTVANAMAPYSVFNTFPPTTTGSMTIINQV